MVENPLIQRATDRPIELIPVTRRLLTIITKLDWRAVLSGRRAWLVSPCLNEELLIYVCTGSVHSLWCDYKNFKILRILQACNKGSLASYIWNMKKIDFCDGTNGTEYLYLSSSERDLQIMCFKCDIFFIAEKKVLVCERSVCF